MSTHTTKELGKSKKKIYLDMQTDPLMKLPHETLKGRDKELDELKAEISASRQAIEELKRLDTPASKQTIKFLSNRLPKLEEQTKYTQWRINVLLFLEKKCVAFYETY